MNYAAHYERLIQRARSRTLAGYSEKHHVVPRCMGGNDSSENIVALTAEEHFIAHQLLIKIHPQVWRLVFAANLMAKNATGNKAYGWLRRKLVAALRAAPYTDARRSKISAALKGRKKSAAHKAKQRAAMLGRRHSPESRAKVSLALLGNKRTAGKKLTAEHRAKISAAGKGNKYSLGHRHSDEARAAMSISRKGKPKPPRTPEHTANFVAARWGKRSIPAADQQPDS